MIKTGRRNGKKVKEQVVLLVKEKGDHKEYQWKEYDS